MGDLWAGVACLKPNPGVKRFRLFEGKGAYVNVVSWANSKAEFEQKTARHAEGMGCILVEMEDVQPLEARMAASDSPEELIAMRDTANRQPEDSIFGIFHTWDQDDAN